MNHVLKKPVFLALALAAAVGSAKIDELGATTYDLRIGNTQVSDTDLSGWGWSYEPASNTLTLDGLDMRPQGNEFTDGTYDPNYIGCASALVKIEETSDGGKKALQLVKDGAAANIAGAQASNVYFGTYRQTSDGADGFNVDPIKWRVLQNNTTDQRLFLLADQNLDAVQYHEDDESVTWEYSTIRAWLNGYAASAHDGSSGTDYSASPAASFFGTAFSGAEQGAIPEVAVVNNDNSGTEGGNGTNDKVFLLSIAEVIKEAYGFPNNYQGTDIRRATNTDYAENRGVYTYGNGCGDWWLRSSGDSGNRASFVDGLGYVGVDCCDVDGRRVAVRPALNIDLNSVLFTSRAAGGKSSGTVGAGALTAISDYTGSDWKLTLLDTTGHGSFAVTETAATAAPGGTVSLNYTGATIYNETTAPNEYISAILADSSGNLLYYGRLAQPTSAGGTVTITVPAGLAAGSYTLKLFSEQYNGDYKSDYAGTFDDVALTVEEEDDDGEKYDLWIGETRVTSKKLSGDGWSYAPENNTLTLDNFTYEGAGTDFSFYSGSFAGSAAIVYTGKATLNVTANNTNSVTHTGNGARDLTAGLFSSSSVIFSGDGKLVLKGGNSNRSSFGVYTEKNLTVRNIKFNAVGAECNSSGGASAEGSALFENAETELTGSNATFNINALYAGGHLTVDGGFLTVRAGNSQSGYSIGISVPTGNMTFKKCDVGVFAGTAKEKSYGINGQNGGNVNVEKSVEFFTASGYSAAIGCTVGTTVVSNALPGTGWDNAEGTGEGTDIPVNKEGAELGFKKVEFKAVTYNLWVGGTRVTSANCDDIPGVLGEGAKAVYDPDTQTLTLTNVTGFTNNYLNSRIFAMDMPLTVKGNATLDGGNKHVFYVSVSSAETSCSLTLDGDFTLSGSYEPVWCKGDVTVAGGHLKVTGQNMVQGSYGGILSAGKLTVSGGILEAESPAGFYPIISVAGGGIVISDTHYIRTPFGGSVEQDDSSSYKYTYIADKNGNAATSVIIAPRPLEVALAGASFTYDAHPHALTNAATATAASGTTTIEYSRDGASWTNDLSSLTATDVADSCVIFVRATNPNYADPATNAAALTIAPRPVTFTGKSETRNFTGSVIEITAIVTNGLVAGHTHNVAFSAKGTEVGGPYTGTITAKEAVVIKNGDADVTGNYDITVVNGALTIEQDPDLAFEVSLEDGTFAYDGESHALQTNATATATNGETLFEYSKDGGTWTNELSSLTATDVADSCAILVRATNPNYANPATNSAALTITQADNAWITAPSMAGWTAGATPATPNRGRAKFGTANVTYGVAGKAAGGLGAMRPSAAGSYVATFTVPETENYDGLVKDMSFTIAAAPQKTYKVKFNANGGKLPKGKSMAAQTFTTGKAKKLRGNAFVRKDWVFVGWATRKNGPVAYRNKQKIKNIGKAGKTVTLYAVWAKEHYRVVFDASGGRGKMPVQTFTYGQAQKLASNKFTRKGYVFGGWAIRDPLATVPKVAYRNGQAVKNLSTDGRTVKLYAVWKRRR